jgi:hypothetical protein
MNHSKPDYMRSKAVQSTGSQIAHSLPAAIRVFAERALYLVRSSSLDAEGFIDLCAVV